jgi:YD repeat-containing protein
LGEAKIYAYDVNRNLSQIVTPNGAVIKLYNNPADILAKKFLPEGIVGYTYDSEYNLTDITNSSSTLTFTYDPLSRLTQAQTAGTIQPATSISYSYDLNDNLTSMTDPAGIVSNYVYDTLNQLTDIKDPADQVISHYEYDNLNRRTGKGFVVNGSPLAANYQYDLASQLLSINYQPSTINFAYTYDNVGNRLSLTDNDGLRNYGYDNVYRLTNATNPNETYSYDPVGNRNPLIQTYDAGNRLLDDGTYTYAYDHNGNMITKQNKTTLETTTYSYNSEDQLIGVATPTQTISYVYDALGRRIQKKIVANSSEIVVKYVYNGEDIIQELDQNNQVMATYVHGPSTDEPILVEKNSQKYYYISDSLGSITALVDQSGNIAQTYRYDSFGNILSTTGSLNQPYTYTGREYDEETGLYYYRARYYDAKIGRFLQEDPI